MDVAQQLQERGYAVLSAGEVDLPDELQAARQQFLASWDELCQDRFMGDGGTYRWRRFGRYLFEHERLTWREDTTLYQPREHNPVNGGIVREFAPLLPDIRDNPFLHHLIRFDFACLHLDRQPPTRWQVGVHQVRIVARPGEPGLPTPEGIHLDGEAYTVQHLIARDNVEGGSFRAYDANRQLVYEWLQSTPFDSLFFTNRLLHDATPVACQDPTQPGRREILLIDFDPA